MGIFINACNYRSISSSVAVGLFPGEGRFRILIIGGELTLVGLAHVTISFEDLFGRNVGTVVKEGSIVQDGLDIFWHLVKFKLGEIGTRGNVILTSHI